jgi:DNA polymerase
MPVLEIDFETQSKVDIIKCGAGRYASDPSTKILCTCWAIDNNPVMGVFDSEPPAAIIEAVKKGWWFSAFNAMFEQLIWTYRWPHLPLPKFICTRALAASHGLPQNLDDACKALHIGTSKDPEGRRLINTYSVPRKDGTFNEVTEEDKKRFLKYCSKDVVLSRRIRQRLPTLPGSEPSFYEWTAKTNIRGVRIDVQLAQNAERIAVELQRRGNKEMAALTGDRIFTTNQVDRIKNFLKEEDGISLECMDKDAIEEALLLAGLSGRARRILELRRDFSQASVKKFARVCASVCPDGRVRDTLIYQGAGATGRWSSQGVQFQNLIRYTLKDQSNAFRAIKNGDPDTFDMLFSQPMHALSACVRGIIIPEEGKMLAVSDYNAIEARVLVWLAGQEDAVVD